MKKVLTIFLFIAFATVKLNAQTISVDSVINMFIDANGGLEKLSSINTMQINSTINLEQMGLSINLTTVREKNKLYRIQSTSPMGEGESYTALFDTVGYTYTPAMRGGPMGESEATLAKMSDEEFKMQTYQKDCEGFFSPLVNYKAKGSKAELLGTESVNNNNCYKVKITLSNAQEIIFFISEATGQVRRMNLTARLALQMVGMGGMMRMMGGGNQKSANRKFDVDFEKYKLFAGIPFPTKISVQLGMRSMQMDNTSIQINQPVNPKYYQLNK